MRLPLIHPPTQSEIRVIGDVIIHEGAVVAPGTILQAAPNCRIVIREGACIGMGTLINAYQGDIEIESGAMLGAGVLIVGQGKIGQNACIGSSTTIINTSIEPETTLEAGSLIGDTSRRLSDVATETTQNREPQNNGSSSNNNGSSLQTEATDQQKPTFVEEKEDLWAEPESEVEEIEEMPTQPNSSAKTQNQPVVGQIYINQLLCTLFPERQVLNRPPNDDSSETHP